MRTGVIGRCIELCSVERLLAALHDGPAVLVLEGEAGIGKTTVLRAAIRAADQRIVRVLACTATAPETRLSYAALTDLLASVEPAELAPLPVAQRTALDAALLQSERAASDTDHRAIATAVLSVLEALAARAPLLIAIDDLQWLDRPSARVVEFCARRYSGRIGLIATRRPDAGTGWVSALTRFLEPERFELCRLGPLTDNELTLVLHHCTARPLDRRDMLRVLQAAGGNPFYALELARAAATTGARGADLTLPETLEQIVESRLAGLSRQTQEALLTVAALGDPTLDLLERALAGDPTALLAEAEERGVLELDGGRVRFSHPLLATGVYVRASALRRRTLHARLSEAVTDIESRARHLALAGNGTAALPALKEAARYASARGAPESAAELLEFALELSEDPGMAVRAAEHHFDAGDNHRARELLEKAIPGLEDPRARAAALLLLAEVNYKGDSFLVARTLLEQARAQAGGDARLRVMIDLRLVFAIFNLGDFPAAGAIAEAALHQAERLGDSRELAITLAVAAMLDFCLGRGLNEQRLTRALELEDPSWRQAAEFQPSLIASCLFLWTCRFDEARTRLDSFWVHETERGDEHGLAWACFFRTSIECWSGNLDGATTVAEEAMRRLLALETANGRALGLSVRAQVDAQAGRVDAARSEAEEALALFERSGWRASGLLAVGTLGFLELSLGNFQAAATRLEPLAALMLATGMPEPAANGLLTAGDAAEAFIAVGRLDEAEELVALLERRGAELDRAWATAVGARCRALLLARDGDLPAAERALDRALAAHERLPMPLERGRTLLVLGTVRRRRRSRLAAKSALEEALAIFEGIGSPLWAAQAREQIARLGLRYGAPDRLTPSEQRVAQLAATGLTNTEVAAQLLVTPKTIEAHLSRAYAKLGIRSRAELGAVMSQRPA
ncbi:MAG: ATP-binding protein [Solirubrobacteraceae bacterium]